MKRKVWGSLIAVILLAGIIIVVAPWRHKEAVSKEETWFLDYFMGRAFQSNGSLYKKDNYLYYLDAKTGKNVLICNDATCNHEKEKCSAYFDSLCLMGIVEKNKLLLVTDYKADKLGEIYLYEAAVNGTERRQIAKLSDNMQFITKTVITEKYVVLAYYNTYDENHENLKAPVAGIYVYDRKKKEGSTICATEMWNALIFSVNLQEDDTIYYSFFGYDMEREDALKHADDMEYMNQYRESGIYRVDITGRNHEKVQESDETLILLPYDNQYFFNNKNKLYAWDVKSGEKKEIGDSMVLIPTFQKGVMYFRKYDEAKERNILYCYDGRMTELGYIKKNYVLNAIYEDVVYILDYEDKENDMKCVRTVEEVLE